MKVTIIIPSCSSGRIPLLFQTIDSIQAGTYKDINLVIIADGNKHIYEKVKKKFRDVIVISNEKRMDWVFSINRVLQEFESDYYIYAADDLIFPSGCITHAVETMKERFPDGFGVVSIGKKHRSAFGIFGNKWVEHFPNRQVFCPDFVHYAGDSELMRTLRALDKFAFLPKRELSVKHYRMRDSTWRLARAVRSRDHGLFFKREALGWKWGVDFNLMVKDEAV